MRQTGFFIFLFIWATIDVQAQSFHNNGSNIFISTGTVFSVTDSLVNKSVLTNNGNMLIGGVWLNQGTYNPGNGEITFNSPVSSGVQIINHNSQSISKLTISGGGEKVILADLTVVGELIFSNGVIKEQNNAKIIFAPSAIISGGSDQSHINGPVIQKGSGDKLFPIGNGSVYLPVEVKGMGTSSEISITLVEGSISLTKSRELKSVSSTRYWSIDVVSGSLADAQLVLPVRNETIATDAENVIVAEASGLTDPFRSLGQLDYTGTLADGRVASSKAPTKSLVAIGTLADEPTIVVYNAISPNNGDDKNDFLRIGNIESFPNNTVSLFNRWGDKVFEISKYDNEQRVFRGFSNINGTKELGAGTYFYLIDRGDGTEKLNGFISIKK